MWLVSQMQLLFVFVERDNEEVGEPVANYFGITGQETTVIPPIYFSCFLCIDLLHRNNMQQLGFGFNVSALSILDILIRLLCRFLLTLGMKTLRSFSSVVKYHWTTLR